jgi:hypothetical protein
MKLTPGEIVEHAIEFHDQPHGERGPFILEVIFRWLEVFETERYSSYVPITTDLEIITVPDSDNWLCLQGLPGCARGRYQPIQRRMGQPEHGLGRFDAAESDVFADVLMAKPVRMMNTK